MRFVANQKLQEQLGAQTRLVAALQDYSRLARLQFTGGYTSYSTVLQAEQSLFPAELQLASVRAQVFASSVNVYKSMGGGWVDIADKAIPGWAPARRSSHRLAHCHRCSEAQRDKFGASDLARKIGQHRGPRRVVAPRRARPGCGSKAPPVA